MRRILLLVFVGLFSVSCEKNEDGTSSKSSLKEWVCGSYNGKTLYTGPKGGCYYKQSDGEKTYVDRKYCSCLK